MKIGFLNENNKRGELRSLIVPNDISRYFAKSFELSLQKGLGLGANFPDRLYSDSGAHFLDRIKILKDSDYLVVMNQINLSELEFLKQGSQIISVYGKFDEKLLDFCRSKNILVYSMPKIPRISMAQKMDILSSQASIAGYKAVIDGASKLTKYIPQMMTAAGTIKPAKVLVIGVGVAGLQAIATAKRLGAQVTATDIRETTKEQVESLGAKFLKLPVAQKDNLSGYAEGLSQKELADQEKAMLLAISSSDLIITTASIPGRKAPILIKERALDDMKPGAVIVDLAAASGGNCEKTIADEEVLYNGVRIIGCTHLASDVSEDASRMLSRNIFEFINHLSSSNDDDDIKKAALIN